MMFIGTTHFWQNDKARRIRAAVSVPAKALWEPDLRENADS
jgi:hypothetical protein